MKGNFAEFHLRRIQRMVGYFGTLSYRRRRHRRHHHFSDVIRAKETDPTRLFGSSKSSEIRRNLQRPENGQF